MDLNDHTELGDITIPGERPAIEHCDLPGQIESVERAFFVAQAAAVLAKYDASRGMQSPFGFKALFKSQSAIHPVAGKLDKIYQYSSVKGLRPNRKGPTSPRFVCVTQDTAAYYQDLHLRFDLWQRCLRLQPGPRPSQAFYADGTAYIFICPSFFDQAVMPPVSRGSSACPTVVDNRFVINEDANVFYKDYQIYTLLYCTRCFAFIWAGMALVQTVAQKRYSIGIFLFAIPLQPQSSIHRASFFTLPVGHNTKN